MRRASRTIDSLVVAPARHDLPRGGWLWLVLLVGLIVLIDVGLAQWFRLGGGH